LGMLHGVDLVVLVSNGRDAVILYKDAGRSWTSRREAGKWANGSREDGSEWHAAGRCVARDLLAMLLG